MSRFAPYRDRPIGFTRVAASDNGDVLTLRCDGACGPEAEQTWNPLTKLRLASRSGSFEWNRGTREIIFRNTGGERKAAAWADVTELQIVPGAPSWFGLREESSLLIALNDGTRWLVCRGTADDVLHAKLLLGEVMKLAVLPEFAPVSEEPVAAVAPGSFQKQWKELSALRWSWIAGVLMLVVLAAESVLLVTEAKLFQALLFAATGLLYAGYLTGQLNRWRCPRCSKPFHSGKPHRLALSSACGHCGLARR